MVWNTAWLICSLLVDCWLLLLICNYSAAESILKCVRLCKSLRVSLWFLEEKLLGCWVFISSSFLSIAQLLSSTVPVYRLTFQFPFLSVSPVLCIARLGHFHPFYVCRMVIHWYFIFYWFLVRSSIFPEACLLFGFLFLSLFISLPPYFLLGYLAFSY